MSFGRRPGARPSTCGDEETAPADTQAAKTPTTAPDESPSSSGAATKPGSELAIGETAHVDLEPIDSAGDENAKTYPIDATVLELEKGSIDDFKGIQLEPEQQTSTPYYLRVRLEATDEAIPTKDDDPDIRFDGIDDRQQEQGRGGPLDGLEQVHLRTRGLEVMNRKW